MLVSCILSAFTLLIFLQVRELKINTKVAFHNDLKSFAPNMCFLDISEAQCVQNEQMWREGNFLDSQSTARVAT